MLDTSANGLGSSFDTHCNKTGSGFPIGQYTQAASAAISNSNLVFKRETVTGRAISLSISWVWV